jgi:hypothetical protein
VLHFFIFLFCKFFYVSEFGGILFVLYNLYDHFFDCLVVHSNNSKITYSKKKKKKL